MDYYTFTQMEVERGDRSGGAVSRIGTESSLERERMKRERGGVEGQSVG